MARRKKRGGLYHFFIVLPDRMYPFKCEIEGKMVRGLRSYDRAAALAQKRLGQGHFGMWLNCYRSVFHVVGAVLVIIMSTMLAQRFFGSQQALYTMLAVATFLISFQEFYYHRREYQQIFTKSVLDWLTWVVPIGMYLFFFR